ncbi:MAG TPA: RNA polymerase sigma factor [Steroidobacteraceae bacterium]|nr:RNA polymerase sigma factor [Steroidobacteraceae bacterium]
MSTPARLAPHDDDTDDSLLRRVIDGETAAFAPLLRRYNRRLFRLARATLRDDAEAEDALQDAYVTAYRNLRQFRGDASLCTWLSRVVLNECFGRLRRAARRDNVAHIFAPADQESLDQMAPSTLERPEQAAIRAQMRTLLERKVDDLPEAFRVVFVLRCVEELGIDEIAACLDLPESTVRTRYFRARGLLREALARDVDLAERDLFEFGGTRCDRIVAGVMARVRSSETAAHVKDDEP